MNGPHQTVAVSERQRTIDANRFRIVDPRPTHCSCARAATSEIKRENTSVAYVLAFVNFYCDSRGFEPLIHALFGYKSGYSETRRENARITYAFDFLIFIGAAKRIRTPDPRITNALLYQLSYCGVATRKGRHSNPWDPPTKGWRCP